MKLSTGKVAFPIEFDNGDKAVIYFNPQDRGIQERIKQFESSVQKKIEGLDIDKYKNAFEGDDLQIDLDHPEKLFEMSAEELRGVQDKLNAVGLIEDEYNKVVKEELDTIFASNISDAVFRYCQPFDVVTVVDENGNEKKEMYIMHFMHWLMEELKKYGMENQSAVSKHISKYR